MQDNLAPCDATFHIWRAFWLDRWQKSDFRLSNDRINGEFMPLRTDVTPRPVVAAPVRVLPRLMQGAALVTALAVVPSLAMLAGRAIEARAIAAVAVIALAALGVSVLLWQVHRLARLLLRGAALTPAAASALARISAATAALGILRAVAGGWLAGELGMTGARLASPPGLPDLFLLLLCGVVLCAAQGMAAAARLAEDDAHIV
jgi:hypothetical protein